MNLMTQINKIQEKFERKIVILILQDELARKLIGETFSHIESKKKQLLLYKENFSICCPTAIKQKEIECDNPSVPAKIPNLMRNHMYNNYSQRH